jgi:hypothetical protein
MISPRSLGVDNGVRLVSHQMSWLYFRIRVESELVIPLMAVLLGPPVSMARHVPHRMALAAVAGLNKKGFQVNFHACVSHRGSPIR